MKDFKKIIASLLCFAMVFSYTAAFADVTISKTIYDLTDKEYDCGGYYNSFYYPRVMLADSTYETIPAFQFKNKGTVEMGKAGGDDAILYHSPKADGNDTYINIYADNEKNVYSSGRFVYTGRFYTNTSAVNGTFTIARNDTVNECKVDLWKSASNPIKANTWYNFKIVIDLDKEKDNVQYKFIEENPQSSAQAHILSQVKTYTGETFNVIRADVDIPYGDTSEYCAYDDLKLTYNTGSSKIKSTSNGMSVENTFKNGIFTATSSGSGLFAVALYEGDELKNIALAQSEDELELLKINMVVENAKDVIMKIFRFDEDGTPICVNKTLNPDTTEHRVFINETFDNGTVYELPSTATIADGKLFLSSTLTRTSSITRSMFNHGKYVVVEADYYLPEAQECFDIHLIELQYTSTDTGKHTRMPVMRLRSDGIRNGGGGSTSTNPIIYKDEDFEEAGTVHLTTIFDFDAMTYDIYVNGDLKASGMKLPSNFNTNTKLDSHSIFIGTGEADENSVGTLGIDNLKIYNGASPKDIGNQIQNVHRTSYADDQGEESSYSLRPEASELAKNILASSHPRLIINSEKVEEIKNSTDEKILAWKELVIDKATYDVEVDTNPYSHTISRNNSMANLPEAIQRIMNLGLSYLLTGEKRYADRAYVEAEALLVFDDWAAYKGLDVGEIAIALSICYDWMYDAWTDAQKKDLADSVMKHSINPGFKIYFNHSDFDIKPLDMGWWDSATNWNAVCNGGVILASVAFMDEDAYTCANLLEAAVRGLEYMMAVYYPDGGWTEGPTYWGYNLKYLTMACATLESTCGTTYGIENAPGFSNTPLFSLSLEGKTGIVNLGDSGGGHVKAPYVFYWSRVLDKPEYTSAALYAMEKFDFTPDIYDLIYYAPEYNRSDYQPPKAYKYAKCETVSFTSGHDYDDTFVAMSGGKGKLSNHDHLDSGAIVVDMKGQRLFGDIGAENYNSVGYFDSVKYLFFRARPESHNIFIINPENVYDTDGTTDYYGQYSNAVSTITAYDKDAQIATMDLKDAYARDASDASRTISLDGKTLIVEDSITLKHTSDIYWNWYIQTPAKNIVISADGKSAVVTVNGATYDISFETDCNYTLAVQEAEYYVNVDPDKEGTKHSNDHYRRLVLKLEGAAGTVNVKTIVK